MRRDNLMHTRIERVLAGRCRRAIIGADRYSRGSRLNSSGARRHCTAGICLCVGSVRKAEQQDENGAASPAV
jgi:hypothetical protein